MSTAVIVMLGEFNFTERCNVSEAFSKRVCKFSYIYLEKTKFIWGRIIKENEVGFLSFLESILRLIFVWPAQVFHFLV